MLHEYPARGPREFDGLAASDSGFDERSSGARIARSASGRDCASIEQSAAGMLTGFGCGVFMASEVALGRAFTVRAPPRFPEVQFAEVEVHGRISSEKHTR